jgi:hypothetical protein
MATIVVRELLGNPVFNLIHFGPVNPQKRFSIGDVLLADRPLRDSQNTNQVVGTLTVRGIIIREIPPDDVLGGFNVEARLHNRSMIAIQDLFPLKAEESTGAIVGGTGGFARIRGTARREVIVPDVEVEFTYQLTTTP